MAVYPVEMLNGRVVLYDEDALLECEDCGKTYRASIVVDPPRNFSSHTSDCKCGSKNATIKESPLLDRSVVEELYPY